MKIMNKFKTKATTLQLAAGTGLMTLAATASADSLAEIGEKVASSISAFIGVVTAIGMAAITVIVAIQGFKLA